MNLAQLQATFRREIIDNGEPPFWSDPDVTEFANDAIMEAARRGMAAVDSSTVQVCQIAYATNPVLALDPRIIKIRRALISGQTIQLEPVSLAWLERTQPGWQSVTGLPTAYVVDWATNKIRLTPTPNVAGTVLLTVTREPLAALSAATDVPELPARCHRSLIHWMKYRAFSREDKETFDPKRAALAAAEFAAEFGPRHSARNERWAAEVVGQFSDTLC